jgi:hypothetical protein
LYDSKVFYVPVTVDRFSFRFIKLAPQHVERFLARVDDRHARKKALEQMATAMNKDEHVKPGEGETRLYITGHKFVTQMLSTETFASAFELAEQETGNN